MWHLVFKFLLITKLLIGEELSEAVFIKHTNAQKQKISIQAESSRATKATSIRMANSGYTRLPQQPSRPNNAAYWVTEHLIAGEYPTHKHGDDKTKEKLEKYLDCEITSFIDLTEEGEKEEYLSILQEEALKKGIGLEEIKYNRISIPDFGIPDTKTMEIILETIDKSVNEGRKVYVHCRGGIGRTGTTVGCYLVRRGLGGEEALHEVNRLFQFSDRSMQSSRSPETFEQESFVKVWQKDP